MKKFSSSIGHDTYLDVPVDKTGLTNRDKLFAILSADAEIAGTGLEGFESIEFCKFLLSLHASLKDKNPNVYRLMIPLIPAIKQMIYFEKPSEKLLQEFIDEYEKLNKEENAPKAEEN